MIGGSLVYLGEPNVILDVMAVPTTELVVSTLGQIALTPPLATTILVAAAAQGPPGITGNSHTTVIPQNAAASTWALVHNLGRYPSITVVDTSGDVVFGDVQYIDSNTAQVSFGAPVAGTAYLN